MNGEFLLDTNIVIALFSGDNNLLKNLANSPTIYLPSVVLGELYFGARKSQRVDQNIARIDELSKEIEILVSDLTTAKYYGVIKNQLFTKGKPLPENDIWIAAIAKQHRLILVSRDKHFEDIDDLQLRKW